MHDRTTGHKAGHIHAPALHTRWDFELTIHAPYNDVAPLFGALKEKVWAGDGWTPAFLYPEPPSDIQGAVFTAVGHTGLATWINTAFQLDKGHVQYVAFVANTMVTLINIRLSSIEPTLTSANVTYERTALDPKMNDAVRAIHQHDHELGPHWEESINGYLAASR